MSHEFALGESKWKRSPAQTPPKRTSTTPVEVFPHSLPLPAGIGIRHSSTLSCLLPHMFANKLLSLLVLAYLNHNYLQILCNGRVSNLPSMSTIPLCHFGATPCPMHNEKQALRCLWSTIALIKEIPHEVWLVTVVWIFMSTCQFLSFLGVYFQSRWRAL